VLKSKQAAEAAKNAVDQVKQDLSRFDAVTELSEAAEHWMRARISTVRKHGGICRGGTALYAKRIVVLRETFPNFSTEGSTSLLGVINQLKLMEEEMDGAMCQHSRLKVAMLNGTVSEMQDKLTERIAKIKTQIGR